MSIYENGDHPWGRYSIQERLAITIENIKFQNGQAYFDDIEKLELILECLNEMSKGGE